MAQFAWFSVLASGGRDRRKRRHGRLGVDASFHEDGNANEARTSPRDRVRSENRDLLRRTEGVDVVDCGLQRAARVAPRDDTTPGANLELAAHSASSAVAESPLNTCAGDAACPAAGACSDLGRGRTQLSSTGRRHSRSSAARCASTSASSGLASGNATTPTSGAAAICPVIGFRTALAIPLRMTWVASEPDPGPSPEPTLG